MALVDIGGGAASGLETLLTRLRLQDESQQRQQQIDEEKRSNKVSESQRAEQLSQAEQDRKDARGATQQNREITQADKRVAGQAIGQEVPTGQASSDVNLGVVPSSYYKSPNMSVLDMVGAGSLPGDPNKGEAPSTLAMSTSPNTLTQPSTFQIAQGTGQQQLAAQRETDAARRLKDQENKPAPETEVSLALKAATGDSTARSAMGLLKPPSAATQALNAPEVPVITSRPTGDSANKPDPKSGGLTPNAVYQGALDFALTGRPPSVGLGSSGSAQAKRNAIANTASALASAVGVDLPTLQAEYRANAGTLNKLLPQATATANASRTATDNLDLAEKQSGEVARSGSKLANRYLQWTQGELTPAKGLTQFETYVYTAAREYAKVTSGGSASSQGLTDSAAKEAEKLLSTAQSPEAFSAAVDAMKADMGNVVSEQAQGLSKISDTIGGFFAAVNGVQPGATPKPAGNTIPVSSAPTAKPRRVYDPSTGTLK